MSTDPLAKKRMTKVVASRSERDIDDSQHASWTGTGTDIANQLCEHELTVIFSNTCITTKDLFNFRQVNRNWRDAATAILLQSQLCHVHVTERQLSAAEPPSPSTVQNEKATPTPELVFCNSRRNREALTTSDLASLMSSSPKFPTSILHMKLCHNTVKDQYVPSSFKSSLLGFLKPAGELIKTLRLEGRMSKEKFLSVLNIVCAHTPKLDCLDLELVHLREFEDHESSLKLASSVAPTQIRTLRLSFELDVWGDEAEDRQFMKMLLNSSTALKCIENVDRCSLEAILREKKGGLIRDLKILCNLNTEQISALKQFALDNDTNSSGCISAHGLCRLTVDLSSRIYNFRINYPKIIAALNQLVTTFRDTLEYLRVILDPIDVRTTIRIPSMKKLKSLELTQHPCYVESYEDGGIIESSAYFYGFEEHRLPIKEYFPRLRNVKLAVKRDDIFGTLIKFFNISPDEIGEAEAGPEVCPGRGTGPGGLMKNCLPNVDVFEVSECVWPKLSYSIWMSKLFPNIKVVKIEYREVHGLQDTLWRLCPCAEFIEIYNVSHRCEKQSIEIVDKFFTGFSLELCVKLQTADFPPDIVNSSESMEFLRITPSICDLPRLKELKIKFRGISGQFGSHVSGEYAFKRMPQTKIIFSLHPVRKDQSHYQTSLASLTPCYAQVIYEKN